MPNQPKTPARAFRLPEDLYERLKAEAERRGVKLTAIVIKALEQYLQDPGRGHEDQ